MHISRATRPNVTKFVFMLPVAVAQSSSDSVVICYVFPVLWMTSYFPMMCPMGACATAAASLQCVYILTPLLRGTGCVLSHSMSGAKTRRDLNVRGAGAEYAMHHFLEVGVD